MCVEMLEPLTVLVVEDNEDDLQLELRAFRHCKLPLMVKVARDGNEALEILGVSQGRAVSSPPSLVICDLKLPMYNGDEILRRVRQVPEYKGLPFVIFSSSDDDGDIRDAYKSGANSYVRKPVDYAEFLAKVCDIVEYWLKANAVEPQPICEFGDLVPAAKVSHR